MSEYRYQNKNIITKLLTFLRQIAFLWCFSNSFSKLCIK